MGGNQIQQDDTAPLVAKHGHAQSQLPTHFSRAHQQKPLKPWKSVVSGIQTIPRCLPRSQSCLLTSQNMQQDNATMARLQARSGARSSSCRRCRMQDGPRATIKRQEVKTRVTGTGEQTSGHGSVLGSGKQNTQDVASPHSAGQIYFVVFNNFPSVRSPAERKLVKSAPQSFCSDSAKRLQHKGFSPVFAVLEGRSFLG